MSDRISLDFMSVSSPFMPQSKYVNKCDKLLAFQNVARDLLLAETKMDLKLRIPEYKSAYRTNKIEQMDLGEEKF